MDIDSLYKIFVRHPVISTDTRKITQGSIFFALKGPHFNANSFAGDALEKGASYCVIDEAAYQVSDKCILVDDVLQTLQALATHHRRQFHIPVIAIAGSNGKTTTKELISSVLSTTLNVWATPGNLNNHIGLPLTLLQLTSKHQAAIIEMGANHIGENALLCEIAEPNLGLVTNNGMDHLEGFGNIEGVAKSNSELYYYLLKNDGLAFVNANDEWLMRMSARLNKRLTYAANTSSRNVQADCEGYAALLQPEIKYTFERKNAGSHLSGDYNFDNIMTAIAIGKYMNLETDKILEGIAAYKPANNRSQWIQTGKNLIFLDAYNANPSSMEAALRNFASMDSTNKIVIMGDMFEMGAFAATEHQRMVELCESLDLKNVVLVGEEFVSTRPNGFNRFATTAEAASFLASHIPDQAVIFIKGSRGMKLETLLDCIP
ncbi:MAG: UDP-N-acetylmuramoyl-tripeptide--D-alanyl-D-alanine ligase [Bacteroidota bacterium]